MHKRLLVAFLVLLGALYEGPVRSQTMPTVRIGLNQNAATVSVRAASPFTIQQNRTRTAKFTIVTVLDPAATGVITPTNLQYRTLVEIEGGKLIVLPKTEKVRIEPGVAIEFDN